jgi:hypothetical protein
MNIKSVPQSISQAPSTINIIDEIYNTIKISRGTQFGTTNPKTKAKTNELIDIRRKNKKLRNLHDH